MRQIKLTEEQCKMLRYALSDVLDCAQSALQKINNNREYRKMLIGFRIKINVTREEQKQYIVALQRLRKKFLRGK